MASDPDHRQANDHRSLVEGVNATAIERPASATEVADLLRTASSSGRSMVPFGGRLSLGTGNAAAPADIGLDLTGLSGVHSYLPADLTMSVSAGTRLEEIREALGAHDQELPIDVPFPERATIGGLIATGFSGPRRLGSGSLKDLIIGCEYVRGDGLLAKAGGMVVKNVSGFEIPRFLHGSWGSLAVMTSVNLKVLPTPRSEATLLINVSSMLSGLELASVLPRTQPSLAACTVSCGEAETVVAIRVPGREAAVGAIISELKRAAGAMAAQDIRMLNAGPSRTFWRTQCERWAVSVGDVVVLVGTRPRDAARVVATVVERFGSAPQPIEVMASPATGSVRFRFNAASVPAGEFWQRLDLKSLPNQTVGYVESAPLAWKQGINVWSSDANRDPLMQSIKQEFDPRAILNPGRLFI